MNDLITCPRREAVSRYDVVFREGEAVLGEGRCPRQAACDRDEPRPSATKVERVTGLPAEAGAGELKLANLHEELFRDPFPESCGELWTRAVGNSSKDCGEHAVDREEHIGIMLVPKGRGEVENARDRSTTGCD
jgi:hypothetical protein